MANLRQYLNYSRFRVSVFVKTDPTRYGWAAGGRGGGSLQRNVNATHLVRPNRHIGQFGRTSAVPVAGPNALARKNIRLYLLRSKADLSQISH